MRKIDFIVLIAIFGISCNEAVKQSENAKLQAELAECKKTVEEFQNTQQVRLAVGQKYLADNDFENAKKTFYYYHHCVYFLKKHHAFNYCLLLKMLKKLLPLIRLLFKKSIMHLIDN